MEHGCEKEHRVCDRLVVMIDNVTALASELKALEESLADPDLLSDQQRYKTAMQRHAELSTIVKAGEEYKAAVQEVADLKSLVNDPDLGEEARAELEHLEPHVEQLERELELLLLPKDPLDAKNIIVEIRAAAGGDEASLFTGDLLNMYTRYASELGYQTELLDSHPTDVGGFSRVSFEIRGADAYRRFKYESGVHRVQRIPETEAQGRIHTSTVTVAVLPEADAVDINIAPSDYRVDVFRSSGPGGQSVNTTDSAVRITYKPGTEDEIIVTCQDGKSQHKNREKALTVLRARVLERQREKEQAEAREARLVQIGTGDRSERIRTYNFPQSRLTDHRIGYTSRDLANVMMGDLEELIHALESVEQERRLAELSSGAGDAA